MWAQGATAGSHKSARMGRMPVSKIARIVVDTVKLLPIRCETLRQHPWPVKEPAAKKPGKACDQNWRLLCTYPLTSIVSPKRRRRGDFPAPRSPLPAPLPYKGEGQGEGSAVCPPITSNRTPGEGGACVVRESGIILLTKP